MSRGSTTGPARPSDGPPRRVRRQRSFWLAVAFACTLLGSCDKSDGTGDVGALSQSPFTESGASDDFHVRLDQPSPRHSGSPARRQGSTLPLAAARLAADRSNEASFALFRAVRPSENYVMSPYRVRSSLGAFSAALRPTSAAVRLRAVLRYPQAADPAADLELLSHVVAAAESPHLFVASGLWMAREGAAGNPHARPQPLAAVSELHSVRLAADPIRARTVIDEWAATRTNGGMPRFMAGRRLTSSSQVALLDLAYLSWPGAPVSSGSRTPRLPFTTADGRKLRVDGLACTECSAVVLDDCVVASVGYPGEDGVRLVVVMPSDWGAFNWDAAMFRRVWQRQKTWRHARFAMPKFTVESSVDVREVLARLGVELQFVASTASRSSRGLRRFDVVGHSAGIRIEAAAVVFEPMVGQVADGLLPPPVPVVIDRPFYWALVERRTDLVLMMGQVTDPTVTGA